MVSRWLASVGLAAIAIIVLAACGSSATGGTGSGGSGGSSANPAAASSGGSLKTAKIGGATVLTNAKGFTVYWFAPDTSTASNCNGTCTRFWPPVKGAVKAGTGVTGKLGTITRSDGSVQATYNGHPLYTYVHDTSPGQAKGDGLDLEGGVWHEVTVSGAAPQPQPSHSSSGGGGGGYGY